MNILKHLILGLVIMGCCGGKCRGGDNVAKKYNNGDQIILQFSADWCSPCRMLKQTIADSKELQTFFKEKTKGYFVIDIEDQSELTKAWIHKAGVQRIPLIVLYKYHDGEWEQKSSMMGYHTAPSLLTWLNEQGN